VGQLRFSRSWIVPGSESARESGSAPGWDSGMPMGSGLGRARTPAKRTVVVVKRVESFMAENFNLDLRFEQKVDRNKSLMLVAVNMGIGGAVRQTLGAFFSARSDELWV